MCHGSVIITVRQQANPCYYAQKNISNKELSYRRETAVCESISNAAQLCEKFIWKANNIVKWLWAFLKVTEIATIIYIIIISYITLLVNCSDNVIVLHRYRDIITFVVYVK